MDAHSLVRTIRYNWLLILLSALLGACGGLLFASVTKPEYSATAELFVTVTNGGSTGELAQGSNYSQQQARNFSAVATREIVLGPVIDDLGLDTNVEALKQLLRVTVPLNTSMISIEVTDDSPEVAARVANSVAENLAIAVGGLAPVIDNLNESPVRLQVVEKASPAESPSVPNVPLWVLLGLVSGVVAGVAWMTVREFVVARVRSREQVDGVASINYLGSVSLDRNARRHPIPLSSDPFSIRAEEYRQLRSTLRFIDPGSMHKAFVITSSVPGEGKSTTAANLAQAIAVAGQSVCLVEADLRRPTLGDLLDLDGSVGLTTVLAGEASLAEVTQVWGEHGLRVVLAGGLPPNPSELLESPAAEKLLQELRSTYAVTIIDSPPLNAVADTSALSRIFGGILLVVGVKRVQLRELRRAVEQMASVNVPIHGYILNGAVGGRRNQPYYRANAAAVETEARSRASKSAVGSGPLAAGGRSPDSEELVDPDPASLRSPDLQVESPVPPVSRARFRTRENRAARSPRSPEPTPNDLRPDILTGAENP